MRALLRVPRLFPYSRQSWRIVRARAKYQLFAARLGNFRERLAKFPRDPKYTRPHSPRGFAARLIRGLFRVLWPRPH